MRQNIFLPSFLTVHEAESNYMELVIWSHISFIDEVSVTPPWVFCMILMFINWMDHVCKFHSVTIKILIIIPVVDSCRIGMLLE